MKVRHANRPRGKNLDDRAIGEIVSILDGWSGALTWELLIRTIATRMRTQYTRQALHKHARIKQAFSARKKALTGAPGQSHRAKSPELQLALQRIARLEAENERIKSENARLLEQFVRWAYNAHTRGLDQAFLNQPLPPVHRDRTFRPEVVKKA